MLPDAELSKALSAISTQTFAGPLFRAVNATRLLRCHLSGTPSALFVSSPTDGYRFTPPKGPRSLYLSVDMETAYAEHNQLAAVVVRTAPHIVPLTAPTVLLMADAHLENILDLTQTSTQVSLGTTNQELTSAWRLSLGMGHPSPTQRLGQAVFGSGRFQAIMFPSARGGRHACMVIFTDLLGTTASVVMHDPDHDSSATALGATCPPPSCKFNLNARLP